MTKENVVGPGLFGYPDTQTPSVFVYKKYDEFSSFLGIGKGNGFLGLGKSASSSGSSDSSSSSSDKPKGAGITLAGITSTVGTLGGLASILPSLGIGSGSRVNEINATNNGNALIYQIQQAAADKQAAQNQTMYIVGGVFIFIILIFFMVNKS